MFFKKKPFVIRVLYNKSVLTFVYSDGIVNQYLYNDSNYKWVSLPDLEKCNSKMHDYLKHCRNTLLNCKLKDTNESFSSIIELIPSDVLELYIRNKKIDTIKRNIDNG